MFVSHKIAFIGKRLSEPTQGRLVEGLDGGGGGGGGGRDAPLN